MGFVAIKGSGKQWRWWWNDGLLYSSLVKSATTSEEASKRDMSNRSRSAFDHYCGAIAIVRMAQSPHMRKPLVQAARTSDGTPQWCWTIQRITSIQPFSSASSSSVNTFRQATNIFASCSCSFVGIRVARPWLAPSPEQWTYLFFTSTVEYCCSGTVAVAADVTLNDVEADLLGSCCCPFVGIRVGRHWHIRWKNELIYSSLHLSHIAVVALWP